MLLLFLLLCFSHFLSLFKPEASQEKVSFPSENLSFAAKSTCCLLRSVKNCFWNIKQSICVCSKGRCWLPSAQKHSSASCFCWPVFRLPCFCFINMFGLCQIHCLQSMCLLWFACFFLCVIFLLTRVHWTACRYCLICWAKWFIFLSQKLPFLL